jgi:hypothetical protein
MEITVVDERILVIKPDLQLSEAEQLAWHQKTNAFGTLNQVANFLTRPKDDDFKIQSRELRYLPFWHLVGTAKYVYERKVTHRWPVTGPEVTTTTFNNQDYLVKDGLVEVATLEHCSQEKRQEVLVDALTAKPQPALKSYLEFKTDELSPTKLTAFSKEHVLVPPQVRASILVREMTTQMIQTIDADKIFEESVELKQVDLYYRPSYVFTFEWLSKRKQASIEVDAITKQLAFNQPQFPELIGKVLDYDFLFDVGSDAAGTLIPGGGIAVKLAKKYLEMRKS